MSANFTLKNPVKPEDLFAPGFIDDDGDFRTESMRRRGLPRPVCSCDRSHGGVTKTYPGKGGNATHALGPVDLRIDPGSFVSVVGPSGCGKSTLLRLVAGLEMPDTGTMQRYGTPLDGPSHEVGIVFQEHVLFPWTSVLDNVIASRRRAGAAESRRARARAEARSNSPA